MLPRSSLDFKAECIAGVRLLDRHFMVFAVASVADGVEVLRMARRFNAIVCDEDVGDRPCRELFGFVREQSPSAVRILMSSSDEPGATGEEPPWHHVLAKPFSVVDLAALVAVVTAGSARQ